MGQEIPTHIRFNPFDFSLFDSKLGQETELLKEWFLRGMFAEDSFVGGYEIEAWLVDKDGAPSPVNQEYLMRLKSPLVTPELSVFNIELNTEERILDGDVLTRMRHSLERTWKSCNQVGEEMGVRLVMIGTLPTAAVDHFTQENMSPLVRYRALNEQILRMHGEETIQVEIEGRERLSHASRNILLEAATTSFQIHLQVNQDQAVRFYNAAAVGSAPLLAPCANSPFFNGASLWEETRIPLFEQSVPLVGEAAELSEADLARVTFGRGYLQESMVELFLDNRDHFPPLLPIYTNERPERMNHLRLHNGTIWRWIRPLIGFDALGRPHLRIEQRVIPAGPTLLDTIANAAFFYGLTHALATMENPPESLLSFDVARRNFYAAARHGLEAETIWLDGKAHPVRDLILRTLLPLAHHGLQSMGLAQDDISAYLGVMEERVKANQNGAVWQRRFVDANGREMRALTLAYLARQESGEPVHAWTVPC